LKLVSNFCFTRESVAGVVRGYECRDVVSYATLTGWCCSWLYIGRWWKVFADSLTLYVRDSNRSFHSHLSISSTPKRFSKPPLFIYHHFRLAFVTLMLDDSNFLHNLW